MDIHSQEYRDYMEHKLAKDFWFMRIDFRRKQEEYPYSIEEEDELKEYTCFPMEWDNGWLEAFYKLCEQIKPEVDETFSWLQLKEKFGHGRCYYDGYLSEKGQEFVSKFEDEIAPNTCFFCGHPAKIVYHNWMLPICTECDVKGK